MLIDLCKLLKVCIVAKTIPIAFIEPDLEKHILLVALVAVDADCVQQIIMEAAYVQQFISDGLNDDDDALAFCNNVFLIFNLFETKKNHTVNLYLGSQTVILLQ